MMRTKVKITHVTETLLDKTITYKVQRLSLTKFTRDDDTQNNDSQYNLVEACVNAFTSAWMSLTTAIYHRDAQHEPLIQDTQDEIEEDNDTINYADQLYDVIEKETMGQYDLVKVCMTALTHGYWIHLADVLYHTQVHDKYLIQNPKELIEHHLDILNNSFEELNEESDELFITFLVKKTQELPLQEKNKICEHFLTEAIHLYHRNEKNHVLQRIIDHIYHFLSTGKFIETPLTVDLNSDSVEILMNKARDMRKKRDYASLTKWIFWKTMSDGSTSTSENNISTDDNKPDKTERCSLV